MRWLVAVLAVAACGGGSPQTLRIPGDKAPAITVEVLNASGRAGEARVATRRLREAGIDVVFFGNAPPSAQGLDTTRIIVRRGTTTVGEHVRDALGIRQGHVDVQLDASKLLDVSVFLGTDFVSLHP